MDYELKPDALEDLTIEEKNTLLAVLQRAKEFEKAEQEEKHKCIEGRLLKWTNVVKGWQLRWFYLSPDGGFLHYFLSEEKKASGPRGSLKLAGAIVQPSGEDAQMFTVVPMLGDPYKLRATNAKERQMWVDRIRRVVEKHTKDVNTIVKATVSNTTNENHSTEEKEKCVTRSQSIFRKSKRSKSTITSSSNSSNSKHKGPAPTPSHIVNINALFHSLNQSHIQRQKVEQILENSECHAKSTVLLYNAHSKALLSLLDECYSIINELRSIDEIDRGRVYSFESKSSNDPVSRTTSAGEGSLGKSKSKIEAGSSSPEKMDSALSNLDSAEEDNFAECD